VARRLYSRVTDLSVTLRLSTTPTRSGPRPPRTAWAWRPACDRQALEAPLGCEICVPGPALYNTGGFPASCHGRLHQTARSASAAPRPGLVGRAVDVVVTGGSSGCYRTRSRVLIAWAGATRLPRSACCSSPAPASPHRHGISLGLDNLLCTPRRPAAPRARPAPLVDRASSTTCLRLRYRLGIADANPRALRPMPQCARRKPDLRPNRWPPHGARATFGQKTSKATRLRIENSANSKPPARAGRGQAVSERRPAWRAPGCARREPPPARSRRPSR